MRALLVGDNHIGKSQDLGRVPGERLAEQETLWRSVLELSRERRVDVVLHCGDLFDSRRPSPDVILAAERPLVEHQVEGGAPVHLCSGNHEIASQEGDSPLDVLAEAGLIELAREPRSWPVAGVDVSALPWTPVSRLVAADNGGSDRAWINAQAADLLLQAARDCIYPTARHDRPQILLGHWAVTDTVLPNGIDVGSLGGVVLPMADLQAVGFDAIVMGHIHAPQQIGRFLYVGSPQQLDHGDCGSERGCWLWDDGSLEFVGLESRRFVTVGIDENDPLDGIDGAFVKVRGTITEEDHRRFDPAAVRAELEAAGAHTVTFDLTVDRARRDRGAVLDDTMTPQDQLAAYLKAAGVNGSLGARMLERAGGYLA